MKFTNATRSLAIASTLLCASAVAQTRFCIGGDLDHMSQTQRVACNAKMQAVKQATAALHAPEDWHFVVVCGENGWKSYAAYSMDDNAALLSADADTNLDRRETFLREDRLDMVNLRSLQRVVAHEVAEITLRSKDEIAINRQMGLWMDRTSERAGL